MEPRWLNHGVNFDIEPISTTTSHYRRAHLESSSDRTNFETLSLEHA